MKKLLFVCLWGLISSLSYAQKPVFWQCRTPAECLLLADSIRQNMKRGYRPDSLRFPERYRAGDVYYFFEKEPSGKQQELAIYFRYFMDGEDKTLEIAGTPTYEVAIIKGTYLDLFQVWQRYFKPDADLKSLAADGHDTAFIGSGATAIRFIFTEEGGNIWKIYR